MADRRLTNGFPFAEVLQMNDLGSGNSDGRKSNRDENALGMPNSRESPSNMRLSYHNVTKMHADGLVRYYSSKKY
jgi:hypothetical protein